MRTLFTTIAMMSLPLSLGLAAAGCEVQAPSGDIAPEPATQVAPPEQVAPSPAPAPAADTDVAPTAQQPTGVDPGSCCGSPSCQRAAADRGGSEGSAGCGCRRNLPAEVAAQVNCGG